MNNDHVLENNQTNPNNSFHNKNNKQKTILVIEDELDIQELLHFNLSQQGYRVVLASDGDQGIKLCTTENPDLIILDIMLPKLDGYQVCEKIKAHNEDRTIKKQQSGIGVPIIILTAKSEEADIIQGLDYGADDYITKPFSPQELVARVRAHLRRYELYHQAQSGDYKNSPEENKIVFGEFVIDIKRHIIFLEQKPLILTLSEFRLLSALLKSPGQVFTRSELIAEITDKGITLIERNIDVHILSIRKKLGKYSSIIETIRGVGYKCQE